jgi:filamentous hemagglutinin family protein
MKHLLLGAAVSSAFASPAFAQTASTAVPTGGQVAAGSATISTPAAATMQIDQSSASAIINWQSFSIGSAASVRFNQPGASSVVLNRVTGGNSSEIFGRLTSNGQVFLSNPNGVLFAPGASVEVGALFATTLSISNDDFMARRYAFANTGGAGSVVNQGTIITPNGYTALAGPQVRNEGVIVARLGSAALAAGDRVLLDIIGDGLINVSVEQGTLNATAVNSGTIAADGGRVILTARGASNLLDGVVNNSGVIRANSLVERNGEILLNADSVQLSGSLEVLGGSAVVQGSGLVNIIGTDAVNAGAGSILITSGNMNPSGTTGTTGSFGIGSGGQVILNGDGAVTAPGGTITIGSGQVTLSGSNSITASGATVQVTGNALTVDGNTTLLGGSESGPVQLSEENLRVLGTNGFAPGATIGEMIRQATVPDYRTGRPDVLSGPIGPLPPMRHQVQAGGISLPAAATLP